jgi:hypothetical protein
MSEYEDEIDVDRVRDDYYIERQRKKLEEEKREMKIREEFEYRKRTGAIEFDYASFEEWRRRFKL